MRPCHTYKRSQPDHAFALLGSERSVVAPTLSSLHPSKSRVSLSLASHPSDNNFESVGLRQRAVFACECNIGLHFDGRRCGEFRPSNATEPMQSLYHDRGSYELQRKTPEGVFEDDLLLHYKPKSYVPWRPRIRRISPVHPFWYRGCSDGLSFSRSPPSRYFGC